MSSLRFRAAVVTALVAGFLGATACGSGFLDGLSGGPLTTTEPPPPAEAKPNIGCVGRVPPDGSMGADGPSVAPLSFAFESARVTTTAIDSGAPLPVGYNLDHLCTCGGVDIVEACIPPDAGVNTPHNTPCDGDGGIDNGLAGLFGVLSVLAPAFRADFAADRIQAGIFTVLIDVYNWNGQPEDPQVLVHLRMSPGIDRDAVGRKTPLFDGTDVWQVDPGSVLEGSSNLGTDCRTDDAGHFCTPTIADGHAFVTGGHLVAHPKNTQGTAPLVLASSVGRITIDLASPTLNAVLAPRGQGLWQMTGELTGRWPVGSLLNSVANTENPSRPGFGICEGDGGVTLYAALKTTVCAGLDIAATSDNDSNPRTPCGALSSALSFVASTATAGHIVAHVPSNTNCLDWKDDCTH